MNDRLDQERRSHRRRWLGGAAAVVVAVAGITALAAQRGSSDVGAPATDSTAAPSSTVARVSELAEFVGDDPLGLLGDGWERIARDTTEFEYAVTSCPAQETYASLTGSPVVADTYRSPVGDGVEVGVSVIEVSDPAKRAQLVAAASDELSECPLDTSLGIDRGVTVLEQRHQGASGFYGSHRGFIVVAPGETDAAPFALILEPSGDSIPSSVVDHLVGRSRALLLASEQPTGPPPYLEAASIELGADPLGLVPNGWMLRWRDTDRLLVGERSNDCLEWTEFDTIDGTTYWADDMTNSDGGREWDLEIGYWALATGEATVLVDGFEQLVRCPSVEDAGRDAELYTIHTDDESWMLGGYFVTGEAAHVAIATPDGKAVTLRTTRFELNRTDLHDLVSAATGYLDSPASRPPAIRYEPVTPGVTSPRLDSMPPDPLGLLADGLDGRDTYATDVDLRFLPPGVCEPQLSGIVERGRLPALSGSYWTSEPTGYQVDIEIVDLMSTDAANAYWNAAPFITLCSIATMTGVSLDGAESQVQAIAPDVLALDVGNTTSWYSILGPDGIVATLMVDTYEGLDSAPVELLIDRTRQLLALDQAAG